MALTAAFLLVNSTNANPLVRLFVGSTGMEISTISPRILGSLCTVFAEEFAQVSLVDIVHQVTDDYAALLASFGEVLSSWCVSY